MHAVRVDRGYGGVRRPPVVVEVGTDVPRNTAGAHIGCVHALIGRVTVEKTKRVKPTVRQTPSAAGGAAVGDVAVGFVVDDFALEESTDSGVNEIAKFIGAGSQAW